MRRESERRVCVEEKQRHQDDARLDRIRFPRWPAALAVLAVGALYAVISDGLTLVPRVFVLGLVTVLLVPLMGAHRRGRHNLARWFGLGLVGVITVAVATSVFLLVSSLLSGETPAPALLRDAALLWVINVVTFAVWYWEIDDGGPARRYRKAHASKDFLFPQTNLGRTAAVDWSPGFVDYLFLAFNTSTAFSPTDTAVLSQRAKLLTMLQALLSLVIIAVLAARAINSLASGQG
jgi:hypothetical protein